MYFYLRSWVRFLLLADRTKREEWNDAMIRAEESLLLEGLLVSFVSMIVLIVYHFSDKHARALRCFARQKEGWGKALYVLMSSCLLILGASVWAGVHTTFKCIFSASSSYLMDFFFFFSSSSTLSARRHPGGR